MSYCTELYSPPEAAKRLSISIRMLQNLTREGAIKSILIGRSRRYTPESLLQFIASLESTSITPDAARGPTGDNDSKTEDASASMLRRGLHPTGSMSESHQ